MTIVEKWGKIERALDRLEVYRVLKPTLDAMRKLVALIRYDPAFAEALPTVSMATLVLSTTSKKQKLCIAWREGTGYEVAFADEYMNLSEVTTVSERKRIVRVLLERLIEMT